MGKKRDVDERKIEAFEVEMKEYARQHGILDFKMSRGFRRDIIATAQERQISTDEAIDILRDAMKQIIRNPRKGTPVPFPKNPRTIH